MFNSFAKVYFWKMRLFFSLRYRVTIKGADALNGDAPILILPNHPALIDPILLMSYLFKYRTVVPVITSSYYDLPIVKWVFAKWGAVRVSDLEKGSRNTDVLNDIYRGVTVAYGKGNDVLLYPSGRLSVGGVERILNKKSAHHVVDKMQNDIRVVGVRISGLWGSSWSKAKTGESPCFFRTLFSNILFLVTNFILFMPRREVVIEFEDISKLAHASAKEGRKEFNSYLESFYNKNGSEPVVFLKYSCFL